MLQGEKRRQVENERVHTLQLMLEKEQRFVESLRSELAKSNDTKKQEQLAGAERRVQTLQTQLLSLSSHYEQEVSPSSRSPEIFTQGIQRTRTVNLINIIVNSSS